MMRAAFYEGQRRIRMGECTPVAPNAGEVQVKVSHCGICGTDLHIYHGVMDRRVSFPQIMGHEAAGIVTAIGEGVAGLAVGQAVAVMPLDWCNDCPACAAGHQHICQNLKFLGIDTPGAFQSYWTVPAHTLHKLPNHLALAHGAMIEPLAVACHDVRLGRVQVGDYAVVLGGGPIGILIALVAKQAGARVLVSEINPFRLQLARDLGLDAINPLEADLVGHVQKQTKTAGADVVFEVTGVQAAASVMTDLARVRGRIVMVAIHGELKEVDLFQFFWRELEMIGARVYEQEDFAEAIELAANGSIPLDKIITNIRPLSDLEAGFKQMESGGSVMKILLET